MTNTPNEEKIQLEFTGERYIPGEAIGDIELEHLHRYLLARELVAGKTVLDIACGEGYGSFMLAQVATYVAGVDISEHAVTHAQLKYSAGNLEFFLGSCADIPLKDASVDVVVSFETIEHHEEHDAMMAEIKRVLRPDGFLIISCPDKYEYSDKPNYRNEFHVKELYRDEFRNLLNGSFKKHCTYGQRVVYGSLILSEEGSGDIGSYDIDDSELSVSPGTPHAVYLIAVASDAEPPRLKSGVFQQSVGDSSVVKGFRSEVARLGGAIDSLNATLNSELDAYRLQAVEFARQVKLLQTEMEASQSHIAYQAGELDAYRTQAVEFGSQVKALQTELEASQSHIAHQAGELPTLNAVRSNELASVRFLSRQLITLLMEKMARIFTK